MRWIAVVLVLTPTLAWGACEDDLAASRIVNRNATATAESVVADLLSQNRSLQEQVKALTAEVAKLKTPPKDEKKESPK